MFIDRTGHNSRFNGDLTTLSDEQLSDMIMQLEKKFDDVERQQVLAPGGAGAAVIDVEPAPANEAAVPTTPSEQTECQPMPKLQ